MLLPIGHDSLSSRRLPIVTIVIVALNVLVFVATLVVGPRQRDARARAARDATEYLESHPYLAPPAALAVEGSRAARGARPPPRAASPADAADDADAREPAEDAARRVDEQRHLDDLGARLDAVARADVTTRFGYVPARGGVVGLVTSQFLHAGVLHLLGNLWFLWLVGVSLEDAWGRAVFPAFYVAAGVVAAFAHGVSAPDSLVPLVGASGAVAGAMGAFLVRFTRARIRFVLLFSVRALFRPVTFQSPAYVMLPLWLGVQLLSAVAAQGRGGDGVAYVAHVGGFVFGVGVALAMRFSGWEKRIEDAIDVDLTLAQDDEPAAAAPAAPIALSFARPLGPPPAAPRWPVSPRVEPVPFEPASLALAVPVAPPPVPLELAAPEPPAPEPEPSPTPPPPRRPPLRDLGSLRLPDPLEEATPARISSVATTMTRDAIDADLAIAPAPAPAPVPRPARTAVLGSDAARLVTASAVPATPASSDDAELVRARLEVAAAAGDRMREVFARVRLATLLVDAALLDAALDAVRALRVRGWQDELPPAVRLRLAKRLDAAARLDDAAVEYAAVHRGAAESALAFDALVAHAHLELRRRRRDDALGLVAAAQASPLADASWEPVLARAMDDALALPDAPPP